jgi:transposase
MTRNTTTSNGPRYQIISQENKQILLRLVLDDNMSIKTASEQLQINYGSARRIVSVEKNRQAKFQRYDPNNVDGPEKVNSRGLRGRPTKLTASILGSIERVITGHNTIALKQIKTHLRENDDVNLPLSTIFNALLKLRITLKAGSKLLDRVNSEATLNARMEYARSFANYSPIDKKTAFLLMNQVLTCI